MDAEKQQREIIIGKTYPLYKNNKISTSKYTWLTFIPINLAEQFSKLANVYFLIIGFMQMIKDISISEGQPVILMPLAIVVAISALKDLYEDYQRHKSDNEENQRGVQILSGETYQRIQWQQLQVGDIVRLDKNEAVPADILLLNSSDSKGISYIETKSLDGETNLKRKQVLEVLQKSKLEDLISTNSQVHSKSEVMYELPNPYLQKFKGKILVSNNVYALDQTGLLLRGSTIKNTDQVIGVVCYTGHETKIMLNSVRAKPKKSKVEREMNRLIIQIFLLQLVICCITSLVACLEQKSFQKELDSYLNFTNQEEQFGFQFLVKWGTWILIFTNFVPISLLVTLEMVKFFQGIVITYDKQTYSKAMDTPTVVQSSNLNEELGQVKYIFSDKTGTLTCNVMKYKKLSVNGISFGDQQTITQQELATFPEVTNVDFRDASLFKLLKNKQSKSCEPLYNALLFLALCHTVVTEKDPNSSKVMFNASSPDELALVSFAKFCGFEYIGIDENNNIEVKIEDQLLKFKLLHILEFSSTRKRQSVIVRNLQNNKILILCKGADTVLEKLLDQNYLLQRGKELKIKTWDHLVKYASIGLRTLLLCQKEISEQEFNNWNTRYLEACQSIENREQLMEERQAEIELNLELVGATAIEDMLQDGVGECIQSFRDAGIQVWVLTGDKIETAVNIGYSCKLLEQSMNQFLISASEQNVVNEELRKCIKAIELMKKDINKFNKSQNSLVVSGDSLIFCMKDVHLTKLLMDIAKECAVVLACRVSPKQKMEIVAMVRKYYPEVSTLAIGDGANDVNMISAAHVGIGIKGVEGQQAARSSDFAIGEFKILRYLLFYHGRECYRRNTALICFNFYKNMILVLPQGIENKLFKKIVYWKWIAMGAFEAAFCSFFAYFGCGMAPRENGYMLYFSALGMISFFSSVIIGNIKVLLMSHNHSFLSLFLIYGSILFYISNHAIISILSKEYEVYNSFGITYRDINFWVIILLTQGFTMMVEFGSLKILGIKHEQLLRKQIKTEISALKQRRQETSDKQELYVIQGENRRRTTSQCGIELQQYNLYGSQDIDRVRNSIDQKSDLKFIQGEDVPQKQIQVTKQLEVQIENVQMFKGFAPEIDKEGDQNKNNDNQQGSESKNQLSVNQNVQGQEITFQSQFQTFQRQHTGFAFSSEDHMSGSFSFGNSNQIADNNTKANFKGNDSEKIHSQSNIINLNSVNNNSKDSNQSHLNSPLLSTNHNEKEYFYQNDISLKQNLDN